MTLFFSPGACSHAGHIALIEAGIPHVTEKVNLKAHTYSGGDYYAVNPKGAVPALKLADGQLLTENAAILQFIADQNPKAGLAPSAGEFERYRLQECLSYLSAEVHKSFSPLFRGPTPDEKEKTMERLGKVLAIPADTLSKNDFLLGSRVSVADFYLYIMLSWASKFGVKLDPALERFHARIKSRPSVQEAERREA